jgi:hypothetical protein
MSVEAGVRSILTAIGKQIQDVAAFRATVTAVDGSLITIRREGATTANTEQYASCTRFVLAVNDVVLCIPLGSKPVVIDVIRRAAAATPTFTAQTGAGTTAVTTNSTGRDDTGFIELIPGGAGIASGSQVLIAFAVTRPNASYHVDMQALTSGARAAGSNVGPTSRAVGSWTLTSDIPLTSGTTYRWTYRIEHYA